MNREIKFRAWDKEKLTWVDPIDILIDGEGTLCRNESQTNPREEFIEVMQFTGLKDKNGKEIYEGDVGRINLPDIGYVNCMCEWKIAGFRWKKINELQGISANPSSSWNLVVEFEVIGNIYEKPELLEA